MSTSGNGSFEVGDWLVEPELDRITRGSESSLLRSQVMELLVYMARRRGRVVSLDDLLDDLWAGKIVASGTVYNCVGELRHALSDGKDNPAYIETIPKKGYRLLAPVTGFDDELESVTSKIRPTAAPNSEISNYDQPRSIAHTIRRKYQFIITGVLAAALLMFALDRFVWNEDNSPTAIANNAPRSIAVIPFINMSSDPEQEYFADGLTEELLNLLTRIPELRVTSRTSAFSFKGKDVRITDIGRALGVTHVLEGGVRKSGDTVRITAQLIYVATDTHVWSDSWNRKIDDVFRVQDEIAQAVVDALKIRLIGNIPRSQQTTTKAYELYLQSRSLMFHRSADNLQHAETLLKTALDIDSSYVPSWVQLANIYLLGIGIDGWTPHEGYPRARAAAMEALRLNDDTAHAHALLAWIARAYDYDIVAAKLELKLAAALAPHDSEVLLQATADAIVSGDYDSAIRFSKEAEILDPLYPFIKRLIGHSYYSARRFNEAIYAYRAAIALNPEGIGGLETRSLGRAMLAGGDHDGARGEFDKLLRDGARFEGRALVFQAMGDSERSDAELAALIAVGDGWDVSIARVHAYRGELDEAFTWLDRAINHRDPGLTFGMSGDPFFDNLREDPRFDDVLERMGRKAH